MKNYQTWIKNNILDNIKVSQHAKGFRKNMSIVDNARQHVNKEIVISVDLKDFFTTIDYMRVYKIYKYMGYTNEVSHLLTKLCTNADNVLPQGSPASPVISNIVCLKLDKRMDALAKSFNASYSRYADDMTFSGDKNIISILNCVNEIIVDEGFIVNNDKIRWRYQYQRQEVTGLTVNKKINVSKSILKELDDAIYYCKKFGVVNHMKKIECDKAFYKEHLFG